MVLKTRLCLSGIWDFIPDLDPKYHAIHGGFHSPSANRRHWFKVPVPSVWQSYGERFKWFEGVGWYAREFHAPETVGNGPARLCFDAINYEAQVYLNGEFIGRHEGGYTPFSMDVTGRVRPGKNHLAVRVDNRSLIIKWPTCLGYFNHGGIHRNIWLDFSQGPFLEEVSLQAERVKNEWLLKVSTTVMGAKPRGGDNPLSRGRKLWLRVECAGRRSELLLSEPYQGGTVQLSLPNVPSWSPEDPQQVPVWVELLDENGRLLDRTEYRYGFRMLEVRDGHLFFNGHPLRLRGVCYVADSPLHGMALSAEEIETDLNLIKRAGCNAVRCHTPMDESFYDACDRLGLLVWVEPPIYCYHPPDDQRNTAFANPEWVALALQMAREMVSVTRYHPSVILYGIGNECNTRNPEAEPFFRDLARTLRECDPNRLLSYAALYGNVGPLVGLVDVLGINSYWGWYERIWNEDKTSARRMEEALSSSGESAVQKNPIELESLRRMLDEVLALKPGLALLLTEFGADAVPGFYSASRDLWSENYQADLLTAIFKIADEYPAIVGTFPFCFCDYQDPSKLPNGYWNGLNLKGVVDFNRNPKMAYYAVCEWYRKRNGSIQESTP